MSLTVEGMYSPSSADVDDGQYVPSRVKIIDLHITSADHGEYMPSAVKIIELHR
jgi:hypothetical protein